jgi:archaetidylinositol phosphate synthase
VSRRAAVPHITGQEALLVAQTFVHATRIMNGLTARGEKRLLIWLAERMPRAVHSDHLTTLAALAMVGAASAYAFASQWPAALHLVNVCLFVNWFGDSLDGTVARVRNQQRPRYGFYVDHVIDCAGIALLVLGMAGSGLMSLTMALAFLVAYFLVSLEVFLATYCLAHFKMSFLGFGPTELRILLAIGNLVVMRTPFVTLFDESWRLFDVGAAVAIPGLIIAFAISAVRNGRALFVAEPRVRNQESGIRNQESGIRCWIVRGVWQGPGDTPRAFCFQGRGGARLHPLPSVCVPRALLNHGGGRRPADQNALRHQAPDS